jgi:leader peptidase (prepilin peptidase)/N-methyltransferase
MLEAIVALVAGLLIGSFLNVCIYRLPRDLSVVRPRSYCPACNASVRWFDNIPLYSYIALGGRCRDCGARIPVRYPLVELLTAACFVFVVLKLGLSLAALKFCLLCALLIGLAFADLEERILPDEFTLGGMAAGVLLSLVVLLDWGFGHVFFPADWGSRWLSLSESLLGLLIPTGLLWFVGTLYSKIRHKEGLGFGDVKMIGMIGAFLGLHGALQTLIFGSVIGSVAGLIYIKATGKNFSTYELPFGTFLAATALGIALLNVAPAAA